MKHQAEVSGAPTTPDCGSDRDRGDSGAGAWDLPSEVAAPAVRRRRRHLLRLLVFGDLAGLGAAYFSAQALGGHGAVNGGETLVFACTLPIWIGLASFARLYDHAEERPDHTTVDDLSGIFSTVTIGVWLFFALNWGLRGDDTHTSSTVLFWLLALVLVTLGRTGARAFARRRKSWVQNTVVVGAGEVGQLVAAKLRQRRDPSLNLLGFVDADPRPLGAALGGVTVLGPPEHLPEIVRRLDVDRVVFAFSHATHRDMIHLIRSLKDFELQIDIVPRLFETFGTRVGVHTIEGLPLVGIPPLRLSPPALVLKRTMDIVISACALALLAPLMAVVAIVIRRNSTGPALYRHERVGKGDRGFAVFKYRTMFLEYCRGERYGGASAEEAFERLMADDALGKEFEENQKLARDPRVTRVGDFLRRTSLDELPQLLNVLKGDLSLVGPRPITREEIPRYGAGAEALLGVKPGLTGYWQISGRSDTSYEERVRLDMAYVSSWSLTMDAVILAKTFSKVVLARQGAI